MDWNDFKYVLAVSEYGQLKEAAKVLGVDQATVGRRIRTLEKRLGTRLVDKTSEGFTLSTAGRDILDDISGMSEAVERIHRRIAGKDAEVSGSLRVAMPGALANHWLMPALPAFFRAYPHIQLELRTGPEVVNLAKREADVAIRLVSPRQKDLYYRKLGHISLGVYARDDMWQIWSKSKDNQNLWPMIALYPYARSQAEDGMWDDLSHKVRPILWTAAWSSVFEAVMAGLGLGILPDVFMRKGNRLANVGLVKPAQPPLWLVMHPDVRKSARVTAFSSFVRDLMT